MTVTSLTYVAFLGIVFAAYWTVGRRRAQNALLVVASYAFYAWWDWRFCSLMAVSTLVDYFVGLGLARTERPHRRRALLVVSLVCNLGLLGFFKYSDFFISNFQALIESLGLRSSGYTLRLILPVGISFYTFQTLSYSIDVFRRRIEPTRAFIDYCAYVTFFPQLVAGPIERAGRLLPQFHAPRRFDRALAEDGCRRILWGFCKKMILADGLSVLVEHYYGNAAARSGPGLALATVCFAFQIYCDFSAYSDIATGTARLFGFRLMRNFAYPYLSQSLAEFWRRWHISLSTWFRDYLYIPLGGSRCSRPRRAFSILATFTVSGFWHGAAWHFVVWGFLNGLGILPTALRNRPTLRATDTPGGESLLPRLAVLGRILLTFALVCVMWVFFRAHDLSQAALILYRIGSDALRLEAWREAVAYILDESMVMRVLLLLAGFVVVEWFQRRREHPLELPRWPRWLRWATYTALVWVTLDLGTRETGEFIYFQF